MAYCVHCGVKLGNAEKTCPLCGTEVLDLASPFDPEAPKPFPVRTPEQTLTINRKYTLSLLSLLLLLPALLCLLLDLFSDGISWSIYPAGVLALIWIVFTVPLLIRRQRLYSTISITGAALAGYLFMVERLSMSPGWFFPIVLPALVILVFMTLFVVALIRKWRLRVLLVLSVCFFLVGLLVLAVEALCVGYGISDRIIWSLFVISPCFFIGLLLYIVYRNQALYSELRRWLHF